MKTPQRTPLRFLLAFSLVLIPVTFACGAMERAAAKDPQRCERDPKCAKKRGRSSDCNTQCSDDPACVERCREVELGIGTSGR